MPMSPLTRRKFQRFTQHRRGMIALILFGTLFFISLFAEFIANDRPLLVSYHGKLYFPVLISYTEREFGGDFDTNAQYRDPIVRGNIEQQGWMLWPPIAFSYSTINYELAVPSPAPPSNENWLGTDDQGRDVLARLIYGYRLSVLFGLVLTFISAALGVCIGSVQGFFGGWTDLLAQRFIEIWNGMPELFILMILASLVTPSFGWLLLVLLLFSWMSLAQLVRAEFLRVRNFDYVRAARALGVTQWRILFRHVLPNAMVPTITYLPFIMSGAVTALTTLDFLGFGLPAGSPSLGELLLQGKNNPQAPWLGIAGFFVISLLLALIMFISEAVRDAFDPRKSMMEAA